MEELLDLNALAEKFKSKRYEQLYSFEDMYESYKLYIQNIQGKKIQLGFITLDTALGMIRPSQVVTIIGSTNIGKTALAMDIGFNNALITKDRLILYFNLEIDQNEIWERAFQREYDLTTFDVEKIFIEKQEAEYLKIIDKYSNYLSIVGRVRIEDITAYVKAVEELYKKEVGLIITDHLGLIKSDLKDDYLAVSDNMMRLKETALHLRKPIINLSQTSRQNAKDGLDMFSGKSSGEIENSSQIVITIDKLNQAQAFKKQVPNEMLAAYEDKKIYILEAKIQKKKQGTNADVILIQERRNLRIYEMETYLDNNRIF